jgi:hypothetical protein
MTVSTFLLILSIVAFFVIVCYRYIQFSKETEKENETAKLIEICGYKCSEDLDWYKLKYRVGDACLRNKSDLTTWNDVYEFSTDNSQKIIPHTSIRTYGPGFKEVLVKTKEDVDAWRNKYSTSDEFEEYCLEQYELYEKNKEEQIKKRMV